MKRILVVIDPTAKQQPVLERASWLAQRAGASLELFICDYDQYLAGERFFDSRSLEKARNSLIRNHLKRLKRDADLLAQQGVAVSVDARWDYPLHEGIARKARESQPDLVMKDTHYHTVLRRSVFSNTDWNLVRSCPVPLWLVKPRAVGERPRIIAAVDPLHERDKPAELDRLIIRAAKEVREAVNGELHAFHAYEIAPALVVSTDSMVTPISSPIRDIAQDMKKRHSEAVFALTDKHSLDRGNVHVYEGPTRQLLVTLTEQLGADLVVMGAISRSGLQRLFLGSTAEQVLDKLPCDILIINPRASRSS